MMSHISNELLNLDPYALDEWLETDLRESGLLASNDEHTLPMKTNHAASIASPPVSECTPVLTPQLISTPILQYEPISPVTPKECPETSIHDNSNYLQPFIKALTILGSMQYNTHNKKRQYPSDQQCLEDTEDVIALKRQRNTDAARRSRQRKAIKMESLERRVHDLETENELLKLRTAVAESEKVNIMAKERRYRIRISNLEQQLADAHRALLNCRNKDVISH